MSEIDPYGNVLMSSEDLIEMVFRGHTDLSSFYFLDNETNREYLKNIKYIDEIKGPLPAPEHSHTPEYEHRVRQSRWIGIPQEVLSIDIKKYVLDLCHDEIQRHRCMTELELYEDRNMLDHLKVLLWIVKICEQNNIVLGVGRGSSVSSYVLYLLGVHCVDSLAYKLNVREFLR